MRVRARVTSLFAPGASLAGWIYSVHRGNRSALVMPRVWSGDRRARSRRAGTSAPRARKFSPNRGCQERRRYLQPLPTPRGGHLKKGEAWTLKLKLGVFDATHWTWLSSALLDLKVRKNEVRQKRLYHKRGWHQVCFSKGRNQGFPFEESESSPQLRLGERSAGSVRWLR